MRPVRPAEEVELLKTKILDVALQLIIQEGFNSLTMRRLGKALGMTAPNLYNYYRSKDEIFITLKMQGFAQLNEHIRKAVESQPNPVTSARAVFQAYLEFGLNNPEHYELMFSMHTPQPREFDGTEMEGLSNAEFNLSLSVAEYSEDQLQKVLDYVGLDATPSQRRTIFIEMWSLLHGMITLHLTNNTSVLAENPVETYQHILDLVMVRFVERFMSKK